MPIQPETPQRMKIGEGRISGVLSILSGAVALGAALCLLFPEYLTTAEFRATYPSWLFRSMLLFCIVLAFGFAFSSFILSRKSKLGLTGVIIATIAVLAGNDASGIPQTDQSLWNVSVDWLLIDIIILAVIFIPIELFLPKRVDQTKFHDEWKTDAVYFAIAHLIVQYTAIAVKLPAEALLAGEWVDQLHAMVSHLPFIAQLLLAMLLADLFQYAAHRAFHSFPVLWRFHAVHHSIRSIDWVAGSRLHLVDVLATRAFSYLPLYALGLPMEVFYAYVAIVSIQAVAAHANTRIPFGPLKYVFVTPQYHHWHHSDDRRYYDKNFAIHFPMIDWLFGTYHLPGEAWPESTRLGDEVMPKGFWRQFLYPFRSGR